MKLLFRLLLTAMLAPALLQAQIGRRTLSLDAQAVNATTGNLGIVYVGGEIFVSSRGNGSTTSPPHTVWVFDTSGTLLRQFAQPATTAGSFWGYRDGASDGSSLVFGYEGGIEVLDPLGQPVNELIATAGPQSITQPIVSTGQITTHRAVAYDPDGNGGLGSLFVGDFGAAIEEIALDGTLLHTYPNTAGWSAFGLAYGKSSGTLWISTAPNAGALVEYTVDRSSATLTATGRQIDRREATSTQGGLDIVPGGLDGRGCGEDLLALDQAASDVVTGYRVDLWDGWPSSVEPRLLAAVDDGPLQTGEIGVTASASRLQIAVEPAGAQYFVFVDALAQAPRPVGDINGYKALWELTHPRPDTVFLGPAPLTGRFEVDATAFTATLTGLTLVWQAVVVEPNLPLGPPCDLQISVAATNQVTHLNRGTFVAEVQASGANSFNSDDSRGFFQVEAGPQTTSDPIVAVTFDWEASSNAAQSSMRFDTDQTGMLGAFWNGDGQPPSCPGTYRRGSDLATGLDYTAPENNLASTCPGAGPNAGCEATVQVGATPDYRTLTWRFAGGLFTSGQVFEVDIDTDFGAGVTGDAMAGMAVTIELASGALLHGELAVDPNRSQTASLRL